MMKEREREREREYLKVQLLRNINCVSLLVRLISFDSSATVAVTAKERMKKNHSPLLWPFNGEGKRDLIILLQ
jgi:hypothetical protein